MSAKLIADNTSLFSVAHDSVASSASFKDDLLKISRWAYQWNRLKILFSLAKQTQATTELVILIMYQ